jgi:hypothetical protein
VPDKKAMQCSSAARHRYALAYGAETLSAAGGS